MIRKESGDEIAKIFSKLMSKEKIQKNASENEASDCSYSHDGDVRSAASDMLMSDDEETRHSSVDEIEQAKDSLMSDGPHDKKMATLMSGLGKIAASLRSEGEDFAADVVEATAISISKESSSSKSKTASIVGELKKISKDLRTKDRFAADLVDSTINKIARDPGSSEMNYPEMAREISGGLTFEESRQAKKDYNQLLDYVRELQWAFHGLGHDMTMIGKANKYLTGLGTDEAKVKEVLSSINEMCESGRGENVKKYLRNLRYNIAQESDSPKLLCFKVVNEEFMKFNDTNLRENIKDEMPDEYEKILNDHPELESL